MLAFFSHRFAHMNDTTQLVTKGERHCGTNLLTEVLKLTFGAAACPGSGRFVDSGRTCAACTADLHAEPRLPPDHPGTARPPGRAKVTPSAAWRSRGRRGQPP